MNKKRINANQSYALIVDGSTLHIVFENKLDEEFKKVCMLCEAVLCCRMTPGQKAKVFYLFIFNFIISVYINFSLYCNLNLISNNLLNFNKVKLRVTNN